MRPIGPLNGLLAECLADPPEHSFLDAVPAECIEGALSDAGMAKDRHGVKLPVRLVIAVACSLALFRDCSVRAVLDLVASVVGAPARWQGSVPVATSISEAFDRVGWKVVRAISRAYSRWLRVRVDDLVETWHGFRVVALDGTAWRTPDSKANAAEFGRPGSRRGPGGFPQIRCVALVETLTHLVLASAWGPCRGPGSGELSLADSLVDDLGEGFLLLMDRGFCSYKFFRKLMERDVPFIARLKTGKNAVALKRLRSLKRGRDWLVQFPVPNSLRPRAGALPLVGLRLLKRQRKGFRDVLLLTNLDDDEIYKHEELVELYTQRWEIEFTFREIKVELVTKKVQFRTRTPDRVRLEAYGLLIAYNAVRWRMVEAAHAAGELEPRQLSFVGCLLALKLAFFGQVSLPKLLSVMGSHVLPKRPPRRYDRVVKMPISKFAANHRVAKTG